MIFSSLHQTGKVPFHTVLIHGLVRDELGRKMSKSLGNGVNPLEMIDLYGADALRFALITGNAPGNDLRWREEKFENGRNFINKIWNAFRFIVMNLDDRTDFSDLKDEDQALEDRWIMSELGEVIREVTDHLESMELGLAQEKIYSFLWDYFCDWYIEMVKERLQKGGAARLAAQAVLCRVFSDTMALLHPFMPFVTERIFGVLHEDQLLISSPWPRAAAYPRDGEAVEVMRHMISAIRGVRNVRAEYKIKPSHRFPAKLRTGNSRLLAGMEAAGPTLLRLAGISKLEGVTGDFSPSNGDVAIVFTGGELFVSLRQLVDVASEASRLEKEAAVLQQEIKRSDSMLANRQFLEKAPAAVVEQEKIKKRDYETQLEKLLQQLDYLGRTE